MKKSIRTIWRRFKSETPSFFKNIRNYSVAVAGLSTFGMQHKEYLPNYAALVLPHLVVLAGAFAFIAQLTVNDNKDLDND